MLAGRHVIVAVALGALCASTAATGCATRDTAYHFRAPLVSSVHADALPDGDRGEDSAGPPASTRGPGTRIATATPRSGTTDSPRTTGNPRAPSSPARARRAAVQEDPGMAQALRALVGTRDKTATSLDVALSTLATLGIAIDPALGLITSGSELLAAAESRHALAEDAAPGDLVVFDLAVDGEPASLVGVVVGSHTNAAPAPCPGDNPDTRVAPCALPGPDAAPRTVEFVYLARKVIRRGYVTTALPGQKRDERGRSLNTLVRHLDGHTSVHSKFLAGELFRTFIRSDRLRPP